MRSAFTTAAAATLLFSTTVFAAPLPEDEELLDGDKWLALLEWEATNTENKMLSTNTTPLDKRTAAPTVNPTPTSTIALDKRDATPEPINLYPNNAPRDAAPAPERTGEPLPTSAFLAALELLATATTEVQGPYGTIECGPGVQAPGCNLWEYPVTSASAGQERRDAAPAPEPTEAVDEGELFVQLLEFMATRSNTENDYVPATTDVAFGAPTGAPASATEADQATKAKRDDAPAAPEPTNLGEALASALLMVASADAEGQMVSASSDSAAETTDVAFGAPTGAPAPEPDQAAKDAAQEVPEDVPEGLREGLEESFPTTLKA